MSTRGYYEFVIVPDASDRGEDVLGFPEDLLMLLLGIDAEEHPIVLVLLAGGPFWRRQRVRILDLPDEPLPLQRLDVFPDL